MTTDLTILGIAGSLRAASYNHSVLKTAVGLAPEGVTIETFDRLREIPPFDEDEERNPNDAVAELKARARAADAILFVTPEYNYSVPGVLKNAIDWASRPYGDNSWAGKPVAVMGASIGMLGTSRAQYHLRQSFVFLDMHPVNQPEVMIANAASRFDDAGNLTDDTAKQLIAQLLQNLADWTRQLQQGQ